MNRISIAVWYLGLVGTIVSAQDSARNEPSGLESKTTSSKDQISSEQLAAGLKKSVVVISVPDRDGNDQFLGTGFAIGDDLIATNLHVIGQGRPISVKSSTGQPMQVLSVHASDRDLDLAILKVKNPTPSLPPLPLADSDQVQDGMDVMMIGNPLGLKFSVVKGIVSAQRDIEGRKMLQLAVPIEPGNSGGPVVSASGDVLGIATMKSLVNRNLGFAVAINHLKQLIEKPNPIPLARWQTIGQLDDDHWQTLFGARWQQHGGKILVTGAGNGMGGRALCLSKTGRPQTPYSIEVEIHLDNESGAAGIVFDADGKHQHFGFYPSNGNLRLSRFDGPTVFTWNVLQEVSSEVYRPGDWNRLRVDVDQDQLRCFVNGHLIIESSDRSLRPGMAGLAKFRDTAAQFKNFRVTPKLEEPKSDPRLKDDVLQWIAHSKEPNTKQSDQWNRFLHAPDASIHAAKTAAAELEAKAHALRQLSTDIHMQQICAELHTMAVNGQIDLLRGSLLIARLDGEDIDVAWYERKVDRMAQEIRATIPKDNTAKSRLSALNRYLFNENGFHGSRFDYYHRTNSYLNRVIDDRVGLPISLSVLYIELGKRLDLKIDGVGLPGHFVVKFGEGKSQQFIDVFNEAKPMSQEDVRQIVRGAVGAQVPESQLVELTLQFTTSATSKSILIRMLTNLRRLAETEQDFDRLLGYFEGLVAIDPTAVDYRGMRAIVRHQTGRTDAALEDLNWILERRPVDIDLRQIEQLKQRLLRSK